MTEEVVRDVRRLLALAVGWVPVLILLAVLHATESHAQSPATPSQIDAAGKLQFEVASIRENKGGLSPPNMPTANVGMSYGDRYPPVSDLFSVTNMRLTIYIRFAYKLTFVDEMAVRAQLPEWALREHFDIKARASGRPTKDQMRLMLRSLLEDRFKLKIHTERRQGSISALELVKRGNTGARFQPHPPDSACTTSPPPSSGASSSLRQRGAFADALPEICGEIVSDLVRPAGTTLPLTHLGARNVTMEQIAKQMEWWTDQGIPVVDQTGFSGAFDFTLDFVPNGGGCSDGVCTPTSSDGTSQPEVSGPSLAQAMKEQWGLKLVPTKGLIDFVVLDHVEYPSAN
jgi:uncharacterized protein (TIGR03435 family)